MADDLDPVDARILDILQQDAGLSVAEVADRVGLSASPCWRRIDRLEREGFIKGRVALLDRLDGKERKQLRRLLRKAAKGLSKAGVDVDDAEADGDEADSDA